MYELLDTVTSPADLRRLDRDQLQQLAVELRGFLLESVEGGEHLAELRARPDDRVEFVLREVGRARVVARGEETSRRCDLDDICTGPDHLADLGSDAVDPVALNQWLFNKAMSAELDKWLSDVSAGKLPTAPTSQPAASASVQPAPHASRKAVSPRPSDNHCTWSTGRTTSAPSPCQGISLSSAQPSLRLRAQIVKIGCSSNQAQRAAGCGCKTAAPMGSVAPLRYASTASGET